MDSSKTRSDDPTDSVEVAERWDNHLKSCPNHGNNNQGICLFDARDVGKWPKGCLRGVL